MREQQFQWIKERLKKSYPHSDAAAQLRAAVDAVLRFLRARVDLARELGDTDHKSDTAHFDDALKQVAKAQIEAALALDMAESTDLTDHRKETHLVRRALQWLDGDALLFECRHLLDHADRLEATAKAAAERAANPADATAELPALSQRMAAEMGGE